ncbi:unnamed protein product, partial [Phaeothamnion confervicola]
MDRGTLSFFLDGMKYGEHVVADLGVAFDSLAGGRPTVKPLTLFPAFGFRKVHDRVTLTGKWLSGTGVHPASALADAAGAAELLYCWEHGARNGSATELATEPSPAAPALDLPNWLYSEAWQDWCRWRRGRWRRLTTRAHPALAADLDCAPLACVRASVQLGLRFPLFAGDRVRMARSGGRALETPETAVVRGALGGRLFYQVETQRSEATAGDAGRAWCWLQSDVEGLEVVARAAEVPLWAAAATLAPSAVNRGGWLRVVYEGGAVMRDGVEIDCSQQLGALERGAVVPALERRINSSNVARYLVAHEGLTGWVSERIRGNDEELIMHRISAAAAAAAGADGAAEAVAALAAAAAAAEASDPAGGAVGSEGAEGDATDAGVAAAEAANAAAAAAAAAAASAGPEDACAWLDGEDAFAAAAAAGDSDGSGGFGGGFDPAALDVREAFVAVASTTGGVGGGRWTAEQDMQLTDTINELCDYYGEEPQNLSFRELWQGLAARDAAAAAAAEGNHVAAVLSGKGKEALRGVPAQHLLARVAVLRVFNSRLGRALPMLCPTLPEEDWER